MERSLEMGKDLKGKGLGEGIVQRSNGTYQAQFVDKFGNRRQKKSKKQTGLRTGELIGLKWSDIDFENRTMKIERTM